MVRRTAQRMSHCWGDSGRPLARTLAKPSSLDDLSHSARSASWGRESLRVPACPSMTASKPRRPQIGRDTSELQSLMRISYAVFCLKKKKKNTKRFTNDIHNKLQ